jgi:hypothetical protein
MYIHSFAYNAIYSAIETFSFGLLIASFYHFLRSPPLISPIASSGHLLSPTTPLTISYELLL